MGHYIGVKIIKAKPLTLGEYNDHRGWKIPANEDPNRPGYLVEYPDGHQSWSPKEAFESAYFPLGEDPTKITRDMVDRFAGHMMASQLDPKTTLVKAETATGFIQYEVSSCVDPANYDHLMGMEIGAERIKNTLWKCLGFVLQWGRFGLSNQKK